MKPTELNYLGESGEVAPKKSTRFRKRYVLESDTHGFVGRIFDLSIINMHFDSYEELAKYPDCKYASNVNFWLSTMVRRVESLNTVGDMLWLEKKFVNDTPLPVSKFQWLNVAADAFFMRVISVVDCALILANEVFEVGLEPRHCTIPKLGTNVLSHEVVVALETMSKSQSELRGERNARFHHGLERPLSSDDTAFKMAAMFEHGGRGMVGTDMNGRSVCTARYLKEGLVELQQDFNSVNRQMSKELTKLYDHLADEFEGRFSPKFNDPENGYGTKMKGREN